MELMTLIILWAPLQETQFYSFSHVWVLICSLKLCCWLHDLPVITSICFFSCVNFNMFTHIPLYGKCFPTVFTSIWFLSCMSFNMFTQIPLYGKWLPTVFTSIWFFSYMSSNMISQAILIAKWFTTVITSKWFLSCMSCNMYTKIPLYCKWIKTVFTSIWFPSCEFYYVESDSTVEYMTYHSFHKHMVSLLYEF